MKKNGVLSAGIFVYLFVYILDSFYAMPMNRYVMVADLLLIHALAFQKVKRVNQIISAVLTLAGMALLISVHADGHDWLKAWLNNAPVICLLLSVSLFTIPLYFESYHEALSSQMSRFASSPFQFYTLAIGLTTALASLLNVASLPFVHNLFKEAQIANKEELLAKAMIRGTAINMLWSPAFISVAIVVKYAEVSWMELAPSGIILALLALLLSLALGAFEYDRRKVIISTPEKEVSGKVLWKLFLQLAILLIFVALLQYFTGKSALVTVPLVSFAGPLLLAILFARFGIYRRRLKAYFTGDLPNRFGEVILFTSFGFFGYALGMSELKNYIPLMIESLGLDTPWLLIPLVTLVTTFPCLFGIHPVITISTVAIALPPGSIALSKIQMAGALLLSYVSYGNLSPFSAVNLVIFGLTKANPIKASLQQNWFFTLVLVLASTIILGYF